LPFGEGPLPAGAQFGEEWLRRTFGVSRTLVRRELHPLTSPV
jgi:DNA-binding GntR family transcriptional regulator